MTNSTVAQRNGESQNVATVIKNYMPLISQALPKHLTGERFARLALTTLRKTPKLQRCNPESFVGAILNAAALGLEPGVNGEAWLVPYGREVQMQIGYQGLAKLFWQSPLAERLDSEYVCESDEFSYSMGLHPTLHHVPADGDRGKVTHFYAVVGVRGREPWFRVLSVDQVAAIRQVSRAEVLGETKRDVADPEHWMSRKTAVIQALKLAPKATELARSYEFDEKPANLHESLSSLGAVGEPDATASETVDTTTGEVYDGEVVS